MSVWSTLKNVGSAVGNAALGGGVSLASNAFSQAQAFKYWKKQYNIQRKDALQDYATQRADYLSDLSLNKSREVNALKLAGLSPAMSVGDAQSAQPLGADVRQSDGTYSPMSVDFSPSLQAAQKSLIEAQAESAQADADKKRTETEKIKAEFENWKTNLKDVFNTLYASQANEAQAQSAFKQREYNNKSYLEDAKTEQLQDGFGNISDKARALVNSELHSIQSQFDNITLDYNVNKQYKAKERKAALDKLNEQISEVIENTKLLHEKSVGEAIVNDFKRLGIGVDSSMIGSIAALLTSGHGSELADRAVTTLLGALKSLVSKVVPF